MRIDLNQIELQLQRFIEDRLAIFPWSRSQERVARLLVEAMQHNLTERDGQISAPGEYTLSVHPGQLAAWQSSPETFDALTQVLTTAASNAGVIFPTTPVIRLAGDPALAPEMVRASAAPATQQAGSDTAAFAARPAREEPEDDSLPAGAFLIVNGSETLTLRQAVINIGRKLDNHVVLDDPRVSRTHAQLRAIRGHFVLFDLNSSGGTSVNGQRIHRHTLRPGDVISLAGVPIIYSEESPPDTLSDTSTYYPEQP